MKSLCISILFLGIIFSLQAQEYNWVKQMGSVGFDFSREIQIDDEGNVYSAGFYREGMFTIEDTTLPYVDNMDSYLAKFDPDGKLEWTIPFYGKGVFDRAEGLQLDEEGNIYMLSTVEESLKIGDQDSIYIPPSRNFDILLMKFNSDGDLLWYTTYGGPSSDLAYHMMLRENDIVLVGHFYDTLYFGMDTLVSVDNRQDMLVASVDFEGNPNWAKQYGEEGEDRLYDISGHQNGELVVCGYTEGDWSFGQTQIVDSSAEYDFFLGRMDADGNPLWAVNGQSLNNRRFTAQAVTSDRQNNTYIGTYFEGPISFGPMRLEGDGGVHLLFARIDENGEIDWVQTSESSDLNTFAGIYELDFQSNRIIALGEIGAGMQAFETTFDTIFQQDLLLAVLDTDGNPEAVFHDGGPGVIHGWGLDINASNQLAFTAYGEGEIRLNGQEFMSRGNDIFIGSMDLSELLTTSIESSILPRIKLFPNPVASKLNLESGSNKIKSVRLFSRSGELIKQFPQVSEIPVDYLPAGLYFVHLIGEDFELVRKFVKIP
jgi:hypothetical protein